MALKLVNKIPKVDEKKIEAAIKYAALSVDDPDQVLVVIEKLAKSECLESFWGDILIPGSEIKEIQKVVTLVNEITPKIKRILLDQSSKGDRRSPCFAT